MTRVTKRMKINTNKTLKQFVFCLVVGLACNFMKTSASQECSNVYQHQSLICWEGEVNRPMVSDDCTRVRVRNVSFYPSDPNSKNLGVEAIPLTAFFYNRTLINADIYGISSFGLEFKKDKFAQKPPKNHHF